LGYTTLFFRDFTHLGDLKIGFGEGSFQKLTFKKFPDLVDIRN